MSKIHSNSFAAKWIALGSGAKTVIISAVFLVVVGGVSLPAYFNYQHQQALILAEQQEQERLAAEQAEAVRVAAEEQARLEQEAQAEAERLAAEVEAARLEAERINQERIAAEEEQAQLEAEAQAETKKIAAEEAARQQEQNLQDDSTGGPSLGGNTSKNDTTADNNSTEPMEEPTSGIGKERAERVGAVWNPDMKGWVYTTTTGERVLISYTGASRSLD